MGSLNATSGFTKGNVLAAAAIVLISLGLVDACPNECSGKGYCDPLRADECICYNGFTGVDCSLRVCPSGTAWVDYAYSKNAAHKNFTECSGFGYCDRDTGICDCRPGFTGEACERSLCPVGEHPQSSAVSMCSGRGRCMSIREAGDQIDYKSLFSKATYNEWEADKLYGCVCDEGATGFDCSEYQCPMGPDPYTMAHPDPEFISTEAEIQLMDCYCPIEETSLPTNEPTPLPTAIPTALPTLGPTGLPSLMPSATPSLTPSKAPTLEPSPAPSHIKQPTPVPYPVPTPVPTPREDSWYQGTAGESCDQTCAAVQSTCNLTATSGITTSDQMIYVASKFTIQTGSYTGSARTCAGISTRIQYLSLGAYVNPDEDVCSYVNSTYSDSVTCSGNLAGSSRLCFCEDNKPSVTPTLAPSPMPSLMPSIEPTRLPSLEPSKLPTLSPSKVPTFIPTLFPTPKPTASNVYSCAGHIRLQFRGQSTRPIPHDATTDLVKMYLERLSTISAVDVKFYKGGTICSVAGETTLITFLDVPHANGALEPLVATSLAIPNSSDTFFLASPIVSVTSGGAQSLQAPGVFSVPSTRKDYVCNKRGTCDYSTGNCTCFAHFHSSQGNMMNMRGTAEYQVPGVYGDCGFWDGTELTTCPVNPKDHNVTEVCSGAKHKCLDDFTCNCTGYTGYACEHKACPRAKAWFGEPTTKSGPHRNSTDCAFGGLCDRTTGECSCSGAFGIYEGIACHKMACPDAGWTKKHLYKNRNDGKGIPAAEQQSICYGTGTCMTMKQLAKRGRAANGMRAGAEYNEPWDAGKIQGCHCMQSHTVTNDNTTGPPHKPTYVLGQYNFGGTDKQTFRGPYAYTFTDFYGYDCTRAMCPTGDDVITHGINEIQVINCTASNGFFKMEFRNKVTGKIPFDATASHLEEALNNLTSIGEVKVKYTVGSRACTRTRDYSEDTSLPPFPAPTPLPTLLPSAAPTLAPTLVPTRIPTLVPTKSPNSVPTIADPTRSPTLVPTPSPTSVPTLVPTVVPSSKGPSLVPTLMPTSNPTLEPTPPPTRMPTLVPTPLPTIHYQRINEFNPIYVEFLTEFGDLPLLKAYNYTGFLNGTVNTTKYVPGTKEDLECGRRGFCDDSTGRCECLTEYRSSNKKGAVGEYGDCGFRTSSTEHVASPSKNSRPYEPL